MFAILISVKQRLFLFLLLFFSGIFLYHSSPIFATYYPVNSRSDQSCETKCAGIHNGSSYHCVSVGNTSPYTNGLATIATYDNDEDSWSCWQTEGNTCNTVMSSSGHDMVCGGNHTPWTVCRCEPRYVEPNNHTGNSCSTVCGGSDKCVTIGTDTNASNGQLKDIWRVGQQDNGCGDMGGNCSTQIIHKTVVGEDYCGSRTVQWTNCWCNQQPPPPTPTIACPAIKNYSLSPNSVVSGGRMSITCDYGSALSCVAVHLTPPAGGGTFQGCSYQWIGTARVYSCTAPSKEGTYTTTCALDSSPAGNCCVFRSCIIGHSEEI